MNRPFLANPIMVTPSAFATNLVVFLPVTSVNSLTLDAFLPPTKYGMSQASPYVICF